MYRAFVLWQKAKAVVIIAGSSALFVATVVWPAAAPFMALEVEPAMAVKALDNTLEEFLELVR